MRRFMILAATILMSTCTFAGTASLGLTKNSPQLNTLGSAFKTHSTTIPKENSHDITMGYAGEDVARIINPNATAA